jgi:hypothetical protein
MKKLLPVCLALVAAASLFGQRNGAGNAYHAHRTTITEPSYGLAKVKSLVKRIKEDSEMNHRLSAKTYDGLTLEQKFTYVMIHGEDFSQNCNEMPTIQNEDRKIFAYPASAFGDEAVWSEREETFLTKNRDRVIALIRSTMSGKKWVGANLKEAIVDLHARELIPDLLAAHKRNLADHDILTVLMLLMKDAEYIPFMETAAYKHLYGENSNYQTSVDATAANEKIIIDQATAFYRSAK